MNTIGILLGTTRANRHSATVGDWLKTVVDKTGQATGLILDPKAANLPWFDEPKGPDSLNRQYTHTAVTEWSKLVDRCSAIIVVTAEYNHGYPAPLKNALDSLYPEWNNKPTGIVSYSVGQLAGVRAAEQLKPILLHLKMKLVNVEVNIGKINDAFDETGAVNVEFYQTKAAELVAALLAK